MPIHITADAAITWAAHQFLSRQGVTGDNIELKLKPTKYNLLVHSFNASTVLLTAGVASAIFLALSSAFTFLALGLFIRFATEKEIAKYSIPQREADEAEEPSIMSRLANALNLGTSEEVRNAIFANLGIPNKSGWVENEVIFLDFPIWKSTVDV